MYFCAVLINIEKCLKAVERKVWTDPRGNFSQLSTLDLGILTSNDSCESSTLDIIEETSV